MGPLSCWDYAQLDFAGYFLQVTFEEGVRCGLSAGNLVSAFTLVPPPDLDQLNFKTFGGIYLLYDFRDIVLLAQPEPLYQILGTL